MKKIETELIALKWLLLAVLRDSKLYSLIKSPSNHQQSPGTDPKAKSRDRCRAEGGSLRFDLQNDAACSSRPSARLGLGTLPGPCNHAPRPPISSGGPGEDWATKVLRAP